MFVSIRRSIVVCAFALSFVASLVLGTQSALAQTATLQTDLNDYHPNVSIENSGVTFASNRVAKLVLKAARGYNKNNKVIVKDTDPVAVYDKVEALGTN